MNFPNPTGVTEVKTATGAVTPEAHHDTIAKAIDAEIDTYGADTLAGLISGVVQCRIDEDEKSLDENLYWTEVARIYDDTETQLAALRRRFSK